MKTCSESPEGNLLEFNDVRLALLNVFRLPINENIYREQAVEMLKSKGIEVTWNIPYSKDFQVAEDFLLPERSTDEYFRIELDEFGISFATMLGEKQIDIIPSVKVFLTIYPKIGVGILMFNLRLNKCNVDDLIFLQQSLYGRLKVGIDFSSPFQKPKTSYVALEEVVHKYIKLIFLSFNVTVEKPEVLVAKCIEIRSFSNFKIDDPEELFEKFPQQMYGLLVTDEGWRFVPSEIAKLRMQLRWRTRNFLSVVSFNYSVILVNFEGKEVHKKYVTLQQQVRKKYGCEAEEYFILSSEIAGLNHGPLLMLENASVQRFILEQLSERIIEMTTGSLKELLNIREKYLDAFTKLSHIKIPEIGLLGQNIQDAMMITKSIEEARKTLEQVERTLTIKYTQRINLGVLILTFVILISGIVGILIQTGLLNQLWSIFAN